MLGDLDVAWLPSNCFTFQRLSNGARSVGISLGDPVGKSLGTSVGYSLGVTVGGSVGLSLG